MFYQRFLIGFSLLWLVATPLLAETSPSASLGEVLLSEGVKSVNISLNGESFTIQRNQTPGHTITDLYTSTTVGSLQPMILAPGIETIGELEVIDYLQQAQTDPNTILVDTRTPFWFSRMRIPGSINVPYSLFKGELSALETVEKFFNVKVDDRGQLDFSQAKTIVGYCNGYFCGQTPSMFKGEAFSLINIGYPPEKLKYYRGGMQAWSSLGLTVIGNEVFN